MERAKALIVSAGTDPRADLGPVISKQVRKGAQNLRIGLCATWVGKIMSMAASILLTCYICIPFVFTGKGTDMQIDSKWGWQWCQTIAWWEKYRGACLCLLVRHCYASRDSAQIAKLVTTKVSERFIHWCNYDCVKPKGCSISNFKFCSFSFLVYVLCALRWAFLKNFFLVNLSINLVELVNKIHRLT